ncbi:hypothetical protein AWU65_03860 [Paenibacillus glucanolyticus]|uniref:Uncharacterized protein n=1 Tax=Paenibacillus glucanolyticus TaxID=59843 RepID=A0A163GSH6_9BACL|nr:hypothetical protein AWU65_03860 [Paenibacillus glucanolyticus]OMF65148.1 hypothetical protein BK142_31185 [Paenibacillus glucanolyticus]
MEYKMVGCCAIVAIAILQFFYLIWDIFLLSPTAILVTGIGLLVDLIILRLFFIDEAEELYRKILKKES